VEKLALDIEHHMSQKLVQPNAKIIKFSELRGPYGYVYGSGFSSDIAVLRFRTHSKSI
jgi:hypothetical protein